MRVYSQRSESVRARVAETTVAVVVFTERRLALAHAVRLVGPAPASVVALAVAVTRSAFLAVGKVLAVVALGAAFSQGFVLGRLAPDCLAIDLVGDKVCEQCLIAASDGESTGGERQGDKGDELHFEG